MRHEVFSFNGKPKATENASSNAGGLPVNIAVLPLLAIAPIASQNSSRGEIS
jgi:hypothetical protein